MPDWKHIRWLRIRLLLVAGFLALGAGVLVYRTWTLQVSQSGWLRGLAQEQYLKEIALEPMRGAIVDRNGAPMAVSVMTDSVFVSPGEVENTRDAASRLANALELDPVALEKKLSSPKHFVWVKRRVTPQESEAVRALNLEGVHFTRESRRYYPGRDLAASIIGFAGDGRGLEGIELLFDGRLRGSTVLAQGLRDARGNLLFSEGLGEHEAVRGGGVVLTIDLAIQEIVETELQRSVHQAGARAGTAIVMDPRTGEILAMANQPTFNPNTFWKFTADRWRNRAVTDCFEPGSTLKIFTMGEALQSGAVKVSEQIDCERGNYEIGRHVIHDSHTKGFGALTPAEILVHSSNIGMAKIGMRMGRGHLHAALNRFGFGQRTGIELPGESRCTLRPAKSWSDVGLATISFGQGISVSPLQLITAASAVANDGVWMRPQVVREIRGPKNEQVRAFEPEPAGRVLESSVASTLTRMMVGVTEPGGTGFRGAVPGFQVAGKTGTAQKVDPIAGGYSQDKRVASFVGFVPASDPRVVILVVVDEPVTSPYGGDVAAPGFSRMAEAILRYLKVFPNLDQEQVAQVPPAHVGPRDGSAGAIETVVPGTRPRLEESGTMADVRGMSIRQALLFLSAQGMEVTVQGSGRVARQDPPPGTLVGPAPVVNLTLERRGVDPDGGPRSRSGTGSELAVLTGRRSPR